MLYHKLMLVTGMLAKKKLTIQGQLLKCFCKVYCKVNLMGMLN